MLQALNFLTLFVLICQTYSPSTSLTSVYKKTIYYKNSDLVSLILKQIVLYSYIQFKQKLVLREG